MNFLDRMINSIWTNKRNTILLAIISCVLSSLLLVAFCIKAASQTSVLKIRTSIDTKVKVMTSNSYDSKGENSSLIPMDLVKKMEELSNVKGAEYYVRTCAYAADFNAQISKEQKKNAKTKKKRAKEQGESYTEPYNVTIQGNTETKENEDFQKLKSQLMTGRLIEKGDSHVCLIHYNLAKQNHLAIDSTITVKNVKNDTVSFKVVGIYYSDTSNEKQLYEASNNNMNCIYTDLGSALAINTENCLNWAVFSMKDPEANAWFMQETNMIAKEDTKHGEDYIVKSDDTNYKMLSSALRCTIIITNIVLIAVMFLGAVIITLLVAISMRDRDYEIGILLSMGERKYKIILQLLGELVIPILFGGLAGIGIGRGLTRLASRFMEQTVKLGVAVSWSAIGIMFLCALGFCLVGAVLTIYKIINYRPKQILMNIE